MSGPENDDFDLKATQAQIERNQAETAKLRSETEKLRAEAGKLEAEQIKFPYEGQKLNRDRILLPFLIAGPILGVVVGYALNHLWR